MKKQIKMLLVFLGAAMVLSVAVLSFLSEDGQLAEAGIKAEGDVRPKSEAGKISSVKRRLRNKKADGKSFERTDSQSRLRKPVRSSLREDVLDDEEKNLTAEQREVLHSIEQAIDDDNKEALIRIVQNLQLSKDWPDSVPQSVRLAAVEALEWFGSSCLPEAVGFLSDPDEDVVQCALGQFEDAVEDTDKSDRERANILVMAAGVVTDSDTMDSMLFELNNLRNSVAVDAIKLLWESGNDVTRSLLPDAVESVTGEENIDTPEKLDAWLKENPDEEDE